jgi:hypothetical protein
MSPQENNKKRINYRGKLPASSSGTDLFSAHFTAAPPPGSYPTQRKSSSNAASPNCERFDNKAGVGGAGAIDLVIHLARVDFSAACRSLASEFLPSEAGGQSAPLFPKSWQGPSHREKKSFEELAANFAVRDDSNWPVAHAYLVERRRISPPLVDEMHGRGSLYANDHRPNPSVVFLHHDQHGKVRGASLRDTRHRSVFRPCLGNKLTAWFVVGDLAGADRVAAVESPIDALSYYSLFGCRGGSLAVVSCAGLACLES